MPSSVDLKELVQVGKVSQPTKTVGNGVDRGSLNYPFWGDQTIQIYGEFERFPLVVHCLGW